MPNSVVADINTIARAIVAGAPISDPPEWQDWPQIGLADWDAICDQVTRLANNFHPPQADVKAAYDRLSARATTED